MAQLIVRKLDGTLVCRLKERAARHGRSAEEEHRVILREALVGRYPRRTLKQMLLEMPEAGADSDFGGKRDRTRGVRV